MVCLLLKLMQFGSVAHGATQSGKVAVIVFLSSICVFSLIFLVLLLSVSR